MIRHNHDKNNDCDCEICSGRSTANEIEERQAKFLKDPGWYMHAVPMNGYVQVHTHGMTAFTSRELLFMLPINREQIKMFQEVMNMICYRIKEGTVYPIHGLLLSLDESDPNIMCLKFIEKHDHFMILAPDTQGRYPGDPDCAEPYCHQLDYTL